MALSTANGGQYTHLPVAGFHNLAYVGFFYTSDLGDIASRSRPTVHSSMILHTAFAVPSWRDSPKIRSHTRTAVARCFDWYFRVACRKAFRRGRSTRDSWGMQKNEIASVALPPWVAGCYFFLAGPSLSPSLASEELAVLWCSIEMECSGLYGQSPVPTRRMSRLLVASESKADFLVGEVHATLLLSMASCMNLQLELIYRSIYCWSLGAVGTVHPDIALIQQPA
jgi:hypothetical protein